MGKSFKYKSDVLALILSFVLCFGWTFYYMTPEAFSSLGVGSILVKFRWVVDQLVAGFATWLAASKIYDLGHGNKKREKVVSTERNQLQEEIVKLKNGNGDVNEPVKEDTEVTDELLKILER
jgi:hypothetical protein